MAAAAPIAARARSSGQSLSRRFGSNDSFAPAARAASNAANTASQAQAEIAMLMPDAWTKRAARISPSGRSSGRSRLAAEPLRR